MDNVTRIVAKCLDINKFETDIEWNPVVLSQGISFVPNKPIVPQRSFGWFRDRLMNLAAGGIVKIQKNYYRVSLLKRDDIQKVRELINVNTRFWIRSANPRACTIGPKGGCYDRLVNESEVGVGLLPVLTLIDTPKSRLKAAVGGWMNKLNDIVKKVVKCVGSFKKRVWDHVKGWRRGHWRKAHWRRVKDEWVWVAKCWVRGHYYGVPNVLNSAI